MQTFQYARNENVFIRSPFRSQALAFSRFGCCALHNSFFAARWLQLLCLLWRRSRIFGSNSRYTGFLRFSARDPFPHQPGVRRRGVCALLRRILAATVSATTQCGRNVGRDFAWTRRRVRHRLVVLRGKEWRPATVFSKWSLLRCKPALKTSE